MSDWPPQEPPAPPTAPDFGPPMPDQVPAMQMPSDQMPPGMQPDQPKSRTGLVVTIVIAVVVLLLCCCGSVAAYLIFQAPQTASTVTDLSKTATAGNAAEIQRLAEWQAAKAAFATTGFETVAPDSRQQALAEAATKLLYPDFTLDEVRVDPGSYDKKTSFYTFDSYVTLMHLTADPSVKLVRSYSVSQPAADTLKRSDITPNANRAVERLGGKAWIIYPTDKVPPLVKGIKDQSYVALMKQIAAEWPDGAVSVLAPSADGTVEAHVYTWESYAKSPADDYVDAVYSKVDGTWTLQSHQLYINNEPVPSSAATSTGG